jgi:hypothetical protein
MRQLRYCSNPEQRNSGGDRSVSATTAASASALARSTPGRATHRRAALRDHDSDFTVSAVLTAGGHESYEYPERTADCRGQAHRRPIAQATQCISRAGMVTLPRPRRFSAPASDNTQAAPNGPPDAQQAESARSGRFIGKLSAITIVEQCLRRQLPQRERVREVATDTRRVRHQSRDHQRGG